MKRLGLIFAASAIALALTPDAAKQLITPDRLFAHIKVLASDEFEGRAPSTRGEELSVHYLTEQFKRFGLKPGNPDGTWVQDVPLFGIKSTPTSSVTAGAQTIALEPKTDYVAWTIRPVPEVKVTDSDVVFVGYGVVAPEYGWDDYKGVDVKGKTIVMLVNDPAVPDPNDPTKLDPNYFKGAAMTYYGRWTYKYEIASQKGAAAAVIIHETGPAGYPYEVVVGSNTHENFDIQTPDRNASRVSVQSWIPYPTAERIFTAAGQNLAELKKAAVRKDFHPVTLNAKWSFDIRNEVREVKSKNVVAKVVGSDPNLRHQYVIFTAHWDHLGKDPALKGDQIYNGAVDNASGCAGLLELARAYAKLTPAPKRTMIFLSVTAEEKGLLGSKYYAENPLYPLRDTLANINMDSMNMWGKTRDLVLVGLGNSTLDDIAKSAADAQGGRTLKPDPHPERGGFYRSDHFEFAKQGVPALDIHPGTDFVGKDPNFGMQKMEEYTTNDYHKVSDEPKPGWNLEGEAQDMQLVFDIGLRVANGDGYPEWRPGNEIKAKRDADMGVPPPH
jgi:Zn-dependent M28 family amino/carboxypeptidase